MAGIFDPNLTYVAVPDLNYGIVKISSLRPSAGPPSAPSGSLAQKLSDIFQGKLLQLLLWGNFSETP
jgi:hypothetical protein